MVILQLVKTSVGATWAYRQMRELVKMGVEVHVAMPINGKLYQEYINSGIIVHELNFSLSRFFLNCSGLRKIVQEIKPDIIHSHFVLTTLIMRFSLWNGIKIPRVFQVPGPLHLENFIFRNIDLLFAKKKLDYWIGSCRWTNKCYENWGISKERLFLSYYGSDLEYMKKQPGNLKNTLSLDRSSFVVGMVAYMYAPKWYLGQKRGLKGHEDFIDALSLLLTKYPHLYGVCIGSAWGNAFSYENKVKKYGLKKCGCRLFFLGNRSDVPALYGDMDLVVHPSHSENLGGAAESLLLEVPTISTNVGGFPDIVINNKTGLLVNPKNPEELSKAIEMVINEKVNVDAFKKEGLKLTRTILDIRHNAKEILDIYKKILN